jgi:hypothetical protein
MSSEQLFSCETPAPKTRNSGPFTSQDVPSRFAIEKMTSGYLHHPVRRSVPPCSAFGRYPVLQCRKAFRNLILPKHSVTVHWGSDRSSSPSPPGHRIARAYFASGRCPAPRSPQARKPALETSSRSCSNQRILFQRILHRLPIPPMRFRSRKGTCRRSRMPGPLQCSLADPP